MNSSTRNRYDLLLVVTNDRYGAAQFGTVQRIIDAALCSGHSIQVWACGNCNTLTDCCGDVTSSTAKSIGKLLAEYPEDFSWVACKTCSNNRGADEHITGALTEPGFDNFRQYVDNAAKTVYVGGA